MADSKYTYVVRQRAYRAPSTDGGTLVEIKSATVTTACDTRDAAAELVQAMYDGFDNPQTGEINFPRGMVRMSILAIEQESPKLGTVVAGYRIDRWQRDLKVELFDRHGNQYKYEDGIDDDFVLVKKHKKIRVKRTAAAVPDTGSTDKVTEAALTGSRSKSTRKSSRCSCSTNQPNCPVHSK